MTQKLLFADFFSIVGNNQLFNRSMSKNLIKSNRCLWNFVRVDIWPAATIWLDTCVAKVTPLISLKAGIWRYLLSPLLPILLTWIRHCHRTKEVSTSTLTPCKNHHCHSCISVWPTWSAARNLCWVSTGIVNIKVTLHM